MANGWWQIGHWYVAPGTTEAISSTVRQDGHGSCMAAGWRVAWRAGEWLILHKCHVPAPIGDVAK